MAEIFGYGEDALTLLALKNHLSKLLNKYKDQTHPEKCVIFYRPSFGRAGGNNSSQFGEFDAIVASQERIYLVESKWDNAGRAKAKDKIIKPVQTLRHQILIWYITHWRPEFKGKWQKLTEEQGDNFKKTFKNKPIAPPNTLLAENLEFTLNKLLYNCKEFKGKTSIKNVLLFFQKRQSKPTSKTPKTFESLKLNFTQDGKMGNFINLD